MDRNSPHRLTAEFLDLQRAPAQLQQRLVPLKPSKELHKRSEDQYRIVEREDIQTSINRWDRALNRTPLPQVDDTQPFQADGYYTAGVPITAPEQGRVRVEPTNVQEHDGLIAMEAAAFREQLRDKAREVFMVDLNVVLTFQPPKNSAPYRVYVFDRPVTSATGALGILYVLSEDGTLIPLQDGARALRVVERIPSRIIADRPAQTQTLYCTHVGGYARWSENEMTNVRRVAE